MIILCGFGVSNYYNKLKVSLLEKEINFEERTVYPWERARFIGSSPLGRIPYIETERGSLSESAVILEYIEDTHRNMPLLPSNSFERAKCREFIQHLELNVEWVARRLYKEAFFGGRISDETKHDAHQKLVSGLKGLSRLSRFSPNAFGSSFSAADCAAFFHLDYVRQSTIRIYGKDLVELYLPQADGYHARLNLRPHFWKTMQDRDAALAAFKSLGVHYEG